MDWNGRINPMLNHQCVEAVIWDMDGVLVDTGELHYQTWVKTLAEIGIPFSWEQFQQTFGMNNAGLLTYLLGKPLTEEFISEISERKERLFRQEMRGNVQLLPGAREWLERLSRQGCRQAIASSAPQENIDALVDALGIRGYFQALLSAGKIPGKPDPAVFLLAAERLGATPPRCVVVEDAVAGVEAARRAGMRCLAVTTTNPREALLGADLIVNSLLDLPEEAFWIA